DVLRHVVYSSSSDDPSDKGGAAARTIEWQANDGSVPASPLFGSPVVLGTGSDPRAVTTADFNGDGKLDIAAANQGSGTNTISVLLGDGNGGFTALPDFAAGITPFNIATADFNGDGKLDLVTANFATQDVSVFLGDGTGHFGPAVSRGAGVLPTGVTTGDFNGDGKIDLAVCNSASTNVSILLGDGKGGFANRVNFPLTFEPESIQTGDFNGDGKLDLAIANFTSNATVLFRNGSGSFGAPVN